MDDSSEEITNELENIQLYYENELLRSLLKQQQEEVMNKQNQIDQLQDKISVLLNAFVIKARGDQQLRKCTERCREEKKYLERDVMVKTNAYQEVELKYREMNRYVQEIEDQNKKLLTEISILTEKETIRQITSSQEHLGETRSCSSTPNLQELPRIKYAQDKDDKFEDKVKQRSRKLRLPMKKAKSFNFEKAVKANSKKDKLGVF
ncbi:hypothetical protein LOD99_5564 [Oopsacas minuta]|uniref:Uncharacterized protein n=1 Tax=Oopsacas minuta TaxID=111878 RepID=A0AAV7JPR2_9METZ|nr:hypothetical protein LOD99_5564 [Oopsacas minuta]